METIKLEISYQTLFKIILVFVVATVLFLVKTLILALFAAFVISTLAIPAADWLEKKRIPRMIAVSIIYIVVIILVALLLYWIIPSLIREITSLSLHLPQYIEENTAKYPFLKDYNVKEMFETIWEAILKYARESAPDIFLSTVSFLTNLFYIFVVIAVSFYLTLEKKLVRNFFQKILPKNQHGSLVRILDEIEIKMGKWLMGQIALSIISGALIFGGLTILGMPFALFLAILAAILRFIPFLGGIISDGTGILIAFLISPVLGIVTFLMYYLIQQLEAYVLIPLVMKQAVGLSPVLVIVAVVAGGQLGGVVGALLAIPIMLVVVILVGELILKNTNKTNINTKTMNIIN